MTVTDITDRIPRRDWSTPLSGFVCGNRCDWFTEIDPDSSCVDCGSTTTPLVRYCAGPYDLEHPPVIEAVCCRDCGSVQDLEQDVGQQHLF